LKLLLNSHRRPTRGLFTDDEYHQVERFFRSRPDLAPTPLVRRPALAAAIGLADVLVKDESQRFGMGAFKIAGVMYAVDALLEGRIAAPGGRRFRTLVCATEGNHGRAVARVARERGLRSVVYMRASAAPARIERIRREGAEVILVEGTYDDAVRRLAAEAERMPDAVIVSDTAWPGYEEIPRAIMAGYTWLMVECAAEWTRTPDVVVVQAGVGGLAGAVTSWLRARDAQPPPFLLSAEPSTAACVLASVAAGKRRAIVPGPTDMAGLRCGEVSSITFPILLDGLDGCAAVDDEQVHAAVARLAAPDAGDPAIAAGPSGACGVAVLGQWMTRPDYAESRAAAAVTGEWRALVFNTEGELPLTGSATRSDVP